MELNEQIKNYYFDHIEELPFDKKFHFATRMAAWEQDTRAIRILRDIKDEIVLPGDLKAALSEMVSSEPKKSINAYSQRLPYFDKYPRLYGIHSALFRIRHIRTIYGIDAAPALYAIIKPEELDHIAERLINDPEALRVLSTFAINFLYLYRQILQGENNFIDLKRIIDLKDSYDLSNAKHIQLLIYLYTHCIIGASNFYTQHIAWGAAEYSAMLDILEHLIDQRFDQINLDNKLEYLVSARILDQQSDVAERIYAECRDSVSAQGHFLVDRHNANAQEDRVSFEKSEHRNVLYIMSCSSYRPSGGLI